MTARSVLVVNAGSSSLKFSLFDGRSQAEMLTGLAERLDSPQAVLSWRAGGEKHQRDLPGAGLSEALRAMSDLLATLADAAPLGAIGHRVVHGGERFAESVRIDDDVLAGIDACASLAPLHNPANRQGIEVLRSLYPALPQVAVFDTAFHQSLAAPAYRYALPRELYRDLGVRRYGFHGTSHRYVAGEAVARLGLDPDRHGLITAHLGNGCSATAVRGGRSVDTSMGLTPLEGLVMGTRSGDVDPGLHDYLASRRGWTLTEITDMLNRRSGLAGLSGHSNDMRELLAAAEAGDADARLAIDVFCFRLARQIGALAMSLERLDALVFTGGIGENAAPVRQAVLERLGLLGLACDPAANARPDASGRISPAGMVPALVIATREEWMIARDTWRLTEDAD